MLELLSLQLGVLKAHLSALLLKYKDVAGGQAKHGAFPTLAQSRLPHLLIPAATDPSPWDRLFSSGAAAALRAFRAPVEQGVTARGQNGEFGPQTPGFSHHFHAVRLYLQVLSLHSCSAWAEVVERGLLIPFLSFSAQCQSWWGSGGECHTRALSRGCLWPGRDSGKHLNQEFRCWPGTVQPELGPSHLCVPGGQIFHGAPGCSSFGNRAGIEFAVQGDVVLEYLST